MFALRLHTPEASFRFTGSVPVATCKKSCWLVLDFVSEQQRLVGY